MSHDPSEIILLCWFAAHKKVWLLSVLETNEPLCIFVETDTVFFRIINKCLTDHKVLNDISSSVPNLFKQIKCVDFMLRWCSVTTYYNLNNNWTIWDYSILICIFFFRDRRVLVIQWNNKKLIKYTLSLLSRTLCSVRDRFGSVQKNESDVLQRTHH